MLILASKSPRREKLLKDAGLDFVVMPSNIAEKTDKDLKPSDLALELSRMKASFIAKKHPKDTVIGADTIVVLEGQSLGKPKDGKEAYKILKSLSGETHRVYTGVTIIKGDQMHCFVSLAEVTMKKLSDIEIMKYIETKEPMDKAGAYGIQGVGGSLVDHYKGDFFTIMGLPIKELLKALKQF